MSLPALASGALREVDGPDWRAAFVRGELTHSEDDPDQSEREHDLVSDLQDHHELPRASHANASMNATSSTGESAEPSMSEPTPDDDVSAARNARLAVARARKAQKGKCKPLRYWTEEEETALWAALEDVGPKWSAIVDRYGEGGSINESLKKRDALSLFNKAYYTKKKLLETGKKVPRYLQDVNVGTWSNVKHPARNSRSYGSDEDEEKTSRGAKRRIRRNAEEDPESKVKVKDEEPIVISDDEDNNVDDLSDWNELPRSTPKPKRKRQAVESVMHATTSEDVRALELRLEAKKRASEVAELEAQLYEARRRNRTGRQA